MTDLALHSPGGQAGDKLPVGQQIYDQYGDQSNGGPGGHNVPLCGSVGGIAQICDSHTQCLEVRIGHGEDLGCDKFIPRGAESEQSDDPQDRLDCR